MRFSVCFVRELKKNSKTRETGRAALHLPRMISVLPRVFVYVFLGLDVLFKHVAIARGETN